MKSFLALLCAAILSVPSIAENNTVRCEFRYYSSRTDYNGTADLILSISKGAKATGSLGYFNISLVDGDQDNVNIVFEDQNSSEINKTFSFPWSSTMIPNKGFVDEDSGASVVFSCWFGSSCKRQ